MIPFKINSLSSIPTSSISAPERLILDGIRSRFSTTSFTIVSFVSASPSKSSYNVFSMPFLSTPKPLVVFPCGSISIARTFFPFSARHAERLIAVVDFPTPPFWLATAIILPNFIPPLWGFNCSYSYFACYIIFYNANRHMHVYYNTFILIMPHNVSRET